VFSDEDKISIIEVKSGKYYRKHASLDHACKDSQTELNRRIVLSKYNLDTDSDGVIYYPMYMAMFL
jgi:hypothetical protein